MLVLIGCEDSGVVREAFRALGHDAWSCDLTPAQDGSPHHLQMDVFEAIASAHPPCTFLSVSGLHWNNRPGPRGNGVGERKMREALAFVRKLMAADVPRIAIENPVGKISTEIRKPDQIIQPYQFGEDASKKTCLWLKGLPLLVPTRHVKPRVVDGKERWANQTDSGQNRLPPGPGRWKERSRTYPGIARAFAEQWGGHTQREMLMVVLAKCGVLP